VRRPTVGGTTSRAARASAVASELLAGEQLATSGAVKCDLVADDQARRRAGASGRSAARTVNSNRNQEEIEIDATLHHSISEYGALRDIASNLHCTRKNERLLSSLKFEFVACCARGDCVLTVVVCVVSFRLMQWLR
jgi:hypothetical protein